MLFWQFLIRKKNHPSNGKCVVVFVEKMKMNRLIQFRLCEKILIDTVMAFFVPSLVSPEQSIRWCADGLKPWISPSKNCSPNIQWQSHVNIIRDLNIELTALAHSVHNSIAWEITNKRSFFFYFIFPRLVVVVVAAAIKQWSTFNLIDIIFIC